MFRQAVVLSIVAIVISGCVTTKTGPDFASLSQSIGPPKAGLARVVVLRDGPTGPIDPGYDVKLDGEPLGNLKGGTFIYADRSPGRHQFSCASECFPGVTQQDFTLVAGRTYFFHARPSERAKAMTAMAAFGGFAGLAIGTAVTSGQSNPGPLDFVLLDEAAARTAMSELRLAE
jgi:hypothetical protein